MKVKRPSEKFNLVALMLPHLDTGFSIAWQIRNEGSRRGGKVKMAQRQKAVLGSVLFDKLRSLKNQQKMSKSGTCG